MKKVLQMFLLSVGVATLMSFNLSKEKGWEEIASKSKVTLSQKVSNCADANMPFEFLLLKVKNHSRSTVKVHIVFEKIKNGEVVPTDVNDVTIELTLKPGDAVTGDCSWADENHLCHVLAENEDNKMFDKINITEFNVIAQ